MTSRHVVVVGAGVFGLSCAWHLATDAGLDVTVIDRTYPGGGSTGLSAGVLTRQYVTSRDIELRVRGVGYLDELSQRTSIAFARIGFVRPARDAATLDQFHAAVAMQREFGVYDTRVIDPDELHRLVPDYCTDGILGAIYGPSDGYVDGALLCSALAEEVGVRGAKLAVRTALTGIRHGTHTKYIIETTGGEFPADVVVNAGGPWAEEIGIALDAPLRVVNERHEAYVFQLPPDVPYTIPMTLDYVPGCGSSEGLYFRQEGQQQLIVGLHSNDILGDVVSHPGSYRTGVTEAALDVIVERLAAALPTLTDIAYQSGWAGLYPHSPDQEFVVGPHPRNADVIVACGLGGIGLSVAPVLGEVVADWIRYGEPRCLPWAVDLLPRPAVVATVST